MRIYIRYLHINPYHTKSQPNIALYDGDFVFIKPLDVWCIIKVGTVVSRTK